MADAAGSYPNLFSPWTIRHTTIPNRVAFAPTCPVWVRSPYEGSFTEQAVAYYEERARGGTGLIVIGGTLINKDTMYSPFLFPGLWDDNQIDGLAAVAEAVHRHGAKICVQLLHVGLRAATAYKTDPANDFDATWYMVAPSQVPPAEYPGAMMPKELEDHEIEQILDDYGSAARRAVQAGLDGVEMHMAHGYLPWQFLSPLYNHRQDRWGGSYENRLRFPVEAMRRIRAAVGDEAFMGYRINSTSFWDGDLVLEDIQRIVGDLDEQLDIDYVSLSAGVHHSFIHTPMDYEQGWEREYTRGVKTVTDKPVLLVGRVTGPDVAEELLSSGDADAILLGRQMFADADWANKAREGRESDIRRCVAANYCWRSVIRGGRVQCVYNPTVGREAAWGEGTLRPVESPRRALVVGGGPSGMEYARVAAARGHHVVVYEREENAGGHTRSYGALPHRTEYGQIGVWLTEQAMKNGAEIRTSSEVTPENLDEVLASERPDHVVIATGARYRRDGFQGQTGQPLPGHETGNCVTWDEVATNRVEPRGNVLVVDDLQDAAAPLTALKLAEAGASVRILTRWPMIAMDTAGDVYLHWMLTYVYQAGIEMICDHFVKRIDGSQVEVFNIYNDKSTRTIDADWIVMATGRQSDNALYGLLRERGVSVETIGDATAPRGTYEATYEGHRQARKLGQELDAASPAPIVVTPSGVGPV
jgi:2,4-dienoyl-CoA reductase-like NADH-dependent reductase (Old Yellow Enzyme family)/pyruvate/2-oxoglutarate dehydrogenase complex dihydrolipoamide dehydrogenase (E3) component